MKMLGLALAATAAMMVSIGTVSASATVLCENNQTSGCTSKHAVGSIESFASTTTATLSTTGGILEDTCTGSTVSGSVTNAGSSTTTVVASVAAAGFTWSGCTNTTKTITGGELEFHSTAGSDSGTVTAKGFAVTVGTSFSCVYGAGVGTDLGTFVPNTSTGLGATIAINTVLRRNNEHSNVFCPETTKWVANYTQTSTTPIKAVGVS